MIATPQPVGVIDETPSRFAPDLVLLAVPVSFVLGTSIVPAVPTVIAGLVALAAIGFASMARFLIGANPIPWTRQLWFLAMFVGWAVLSTVMADDRSSAAFELVLLIIATSLLVAVVGVAGGDTLRWLVVSLAGSGGAICLYGLVVLGELELFAGGAIITGRAAGPFGSPNDFGSIAASTMFMGLGLAVATRSLLGRLLAGSVALVGAAALGLSLSRAAWIGAVASLALLLVLVPAARKLIIYATVTGVAAMLVFVAYGAVSPNADQGVTDLLAARLASIAEPSANPYDFRDGIWAEAQRQIGADPLTGSGPGGFRASVLRPGSIPESRGAAHAHNVVLSVGSEVGLPGLGFLVAFTLTTMAVALRTAPRLERRDGAVLGGVAAALGGIIVHGVFDFTFRNPIMLLFTSMMVGVVLAYGRQVDLRSGGPAQIERRSFEVGSAEV